MYPLLCIHLLFFSPFSLDHSYKTSFNFCQICPIFRKRNSFFPWQRYRQQQPSPATEDNFLPVFFFCCVYLRYCVFYVVTSFILSTFITFYRLSLSIHIYSNARKVVKWDGGETVRRGNVKRCEYVEYVFVKERGRKCNQAENGKQETKEKVCIV